jgi:hypothetical protein
MKRQSIEDYQRQRREQAPTPIHKSTPGDIERKQRILDHGLECLRRLHGDQTWEDWTGTGEALMVITEDACAAVGVSGWDKTNTRLVREFNKQWDAYEIRLGSNYKPLSKQERWALREVMTNPEIGVWRGLLDGPQKRRLNHPNAVINKWKASTQTREKKERQPSNLLSPALKEKDKRIGELEAHVQELEAARETGSPLTLAACIDRLIELLQDQDASSVKVTLKDITTRLTEAWHSRRMQGVKPKSATRQKVQKKKGGKGALQQVEDDLNRALGSVFKS